jgi:hypothetical protein
MELSELTRPISGAMQAARGSGGGGTIEGGGAGKSSGTAASG